MKINFIIKIKKGNLIKENANIIINASNTMLALGNGVSMAFKRHCGHKLQLEMNDLLLELHKAGYRLKKGDVVPSSSGEATNFKQALHVAMVDYNPGVHYSEKQPDLSTIDLALKNIEASIIEYTSFHNKKDISLAIPLLGCGVGGLDKVEVVEKYKALFTQNRNERCEIVCNIIVYAYSEKDFKIISDAFVTLSL